MLLEKRLALAYLVITIQPTFIWSSKCFEGVGIFIIAQCTHQLIAYKINRTPMVDGRSDFTVALRPLNQSLGGAC